MKKLFAIILTICLLASVLCLPALAEDHDICVVSGLKADGTSEKIAEYNDFVSGWNTVATLAADHEWMETRGYDRIAMDLYADWVAPGGEFCDDGDGFSYDAIYVPENARVTLNLHGNTINRAMTEWEYNGEVMFIDENADVIINDGTIKGGWSCNGAGGIHVIDKAMLTLNNVHIVGNTADDDDGAGIALRDGATLVMNGGSFRDNRLIGTTAYSYGGAIDVSDSTAVFNNVEFKNNLSDSDNRYGAAIAADDSDVTMNGCTFEGNGLAPSDDSTRDDLSVIYANRSKFTVKDSTFNNNRAAFLFRLDSASLLMNSSVFNGISDTEYLLRANNSSGLFITDTVFSNNNSYVVSSAGSANDIVENSFFRNCTFNKTISTKGSVNYLYRAITFFDCSYTDFKVDPLYKSYIKVSNTPVSAQEGVITVRGINADGTTAFTEYYKDFEGGWSAASDWAKTKAYDYIAVDLHDDWNSKEMGAISILENTRMVLNLNGHTINRNRTVGWSNGEVICVGPNASVTINDGTIKGGYSMNGAGGIHINDNATVVLNDVHLEENTAEGSNGSAIAVYDGATLLMNGGSISENFMHVGGDYISGEIPIRFPYGTLYVNDATATLNNVTISGNYTFNADAEGLAIYADDSTVTLNACVVSGNAKRSDYAESVIAGYDSKLIVKDTDFTDNGAVSDDSAIDPSHLFYLDDSSLTMEGGKITGNNADVLFGFEDSMGDIKNVTITDNASLVLNVDNGSQKVTMTECALGNNAPVKYEADVIVDTKGTLAMNDCTLGDTTFEDKSMVEGVGSMIGEGSLTNILVIISLASSAVSICLFVTLYKKKAVPVAVNNAAEAEDKE